MWGKKKAFFNVKINSISEPSYETSFALLFGFIMLLYVSQKKVGDDAAFDLSLS